jgi:prepilin-type N-terminal cleavage/methylation domain-containing protein
MRRRKAFTMIELIWVTVVLGIVASLGAEMIAQIYKQYVLQRAIFKAETKTELAALQIANRLRYAVPHTVIRKISIGSAAWEDLTGPMNLNPAGHYNVLQWVGADGDSFEAMRGGNRRPGWSGFCDIRASTKSTVKSQGSRFNVANAIIANLSGGSRSLSDAAIFFPGDDTAYGIAGYTGDRLTLDTNLSRIVEHYKLAWSSYALSVEGGDLYLYYNFPPAKAAAIPGGAGKSLLLRNVSTFKFRSDGMTIRFKICKTENIGEDFNVTACKEKAVF